jgi:hypothetical protein
MTERGILFSAPMVRALLDGVKTQTRRALKDKALAYVGDPERVLCLCPYGKPGDRLWVRETFFAYGRWERRFDEDKRRDEWRFVDMTVECGRSYRYAAAAPALPVEKGRSTTPGWTTRPGLFMPRAASRILLEVVAVRVERLQAISEADAWAEGIATTSTGIDGTLSPQASYRSLWERINGAGSWDADPWVWVVEFKQMVPPTGIEPVSHA